jgi:uncharacterized protein YggE
MNGKLLASVLAVLTGTSAFAQLANQPQLRIDSTNRIVTVSAEERVTADPDFAVLHLGFQTPPSDAKTAYAAGAKISNDVVTALKQAGIPEASIRSVSQGLESVDAKAHKFKLVQSWAVETPPQRVAEILDIAISAGATESGDIEWTVKDVHALEDQALSRAGERAKSDATVLAKSMGARLGALVYVSNQVAESQKTNGYFASNFSIEANDAAKQRMAPALAIEPRKVSRTATVYAVFAIE